MKIALTTSSFASYSDEPLRLLKDADLEPVMNPHGRKLTEDEVIEVVSGCAGVVAGTEPLTRRVMDALLPDLKVISRCGVGMDNVDQGAADELGIAVRNTPMGPTLAVVELTLGLALNLLREVGRMDRELRSGIWKKRMGFNLAGKRLGVVGFGRIGRAVAAGFSPHGVEIGFYDPYVREADGYTGMSLPELLEWADMITLHCSKPEQGGYLLGKTELSRMKQGAWLLNCARGGVIDEAALYEVLKSGHLSGAAIDVFVDEPYTGPLTKLDNVILTPHIGSYAREGRIKMEIDSVKNLIGALGESQ